MDDSKNLLRPRYFPRLPHLVALAIAHSSMSVVSMVAQKVMATRARYNRMNIVEAASIPTETTI